MIKFLYFIGFELNNRVVNLNRFVAFLCLLIALTWITAIKTQAQVDHESARKLAKQINWFRVRNFKRPLEYNVTYQVVCDTLVSRLPVKAQHSKFTKYQVGEVYMAYSKDVGAWRLSPNHRSILLSPYAKELCVSVYKDQKGNYWSLGQTFAVDRKNPPPHR